jgi:hypothetical protein
MRKYLIRWWFTPNWEQCCLERAIRAWNGGPIPDWLWRYWEDAAFHAGVELNYHHLRELSRDVYLDDRSHPASDTPQQIAEAMRRCTMQYDPATGTVYGHSRIETVYPYLRAFDDSTSKEV